MALRLILFVLLCCCLFEPTSAQRSECRRIPKRFPSSFNNMSSDYTHMNTQSDVLLKGYFQIETSFSFSPYQNSEMSTGKYAHNSNLIRVGLGKQFEVLGGINVPIGHIPSNNDWPEKLYQPVSMGLKFNILPESSTTPGISFMGEYHFLPEKPYTYIGLIIDKYSFSSLKTSLSLGPRIYNSHANDLAYTLGIQVKERNKRMGIYMMASNTYAYLDDILHIGILISDNLNYTLSLGYGVHENDSWAVFSLSWLFHAKTLSRKIKRSF